MVQILYKVSPSTSKMQQWCGWVDEDTVCCEYGEVGGALQVNKYKAQPKNEGRSNATTAHTQALAELEAKYKAQIDNKHYHYTDKLALEASKLCIIPRKISNYKDRYNKMPETLLSGVKVDGSRAAVIYGQLYSKIGKPEVIKVEHLAKAVEALGEKIKFDSEVYAHGLSLQRIRSAWLKPVKTDKEIIKIAKDFVKKTKKDFKVVTIEDSVNVLGYNPNEDAPLLKFHVFDIPTHDDTPYSDRVVEIAELEASTITIGVRDCFEFIYPTFTKSHEKRMECLAKIVADGYEGLVHYEVDGVYEFGKRSTNTAKSKPRYDAEALVVGVELCKNGEGKLLMQACDALNGVKFKGMMKGCHASRMYEVQQGFIDKWVTFEYEDLSAAGVPTKPTVKETRLCDENGEPIE